MPKRGPVSAGLAVAWVGVFVVAAIAWAANPDEREAQVGKEAAAQVEKEYKIAKLPDQVDRVSSIADALAAASPRPAVKYNCKVLDSFEINAFSLPGGYLYLTRGLLSAVESDDELAAVIAHEIAHNCKRHGMALIEKQAKIDKRLTMATLAAIIAGAPVNPENIAVAGSLLRTALLTGYSRRAEDEADSEALKYLLKSGRWNPVAMLSVLQGLARMDQTRPPRELGILQTHPYAADRAERVRKLLTDMKIEINLRPVVGSMVPSAKAIEVKGQQVGQVSIDERVIFQPAATSNGAGPVERAQKISKALSELLRAGLQLVEIRQEQRGDSVVIRARGRDLIEVLPGDAQFHGMSLQQLSEQVMQNLRLAFYAEKAKRAY
jgi:Zn-dependent protease with chaperone function